MHKTILKITIVSIFFNFGFLFPKIVKVEDLHIYNILQNSKAILMEDILQQNNVKVDLEKKYLEFVDQEMLLLNDIVKGFNNGLLIFLEYKFWGICNFFNNLESIEPRNIRAFERKVIKFDDFIQKHYLRKKNILDENEIGLCNKIVKFDKILLECFLRHDFYNIGALDEVKDVCFYRPVEWMGRHPVITASILIAFGAFLFYRYALPYLNSLDEAKINGYVLKINHNSKVNAIQFKQEKTQWGLTCGAHALFNLIAMMKGDGDLKKTYELINDESERQTCFSRWQKLVPGKKGLYSLDGNDILDILNSEGLGDEVIRIEDVNILKESEFSDFNHMFHFVDGRYTCVAQSIQTGELQVNEFIDEDGQRKICTEDVVVGQRVPAFRSGKSQFFIVNTAARTDLKKENAYGHWLPFVVRPSGEGNKDATVLTVDSSGNTNRTNSWILNRLHQIFVQN